MNIFSRKSLALFFILVILIFIVIIFWPRIILAMSGCNFKGLQAGGPGFFPTLKPVGSCTITVAQKFNNPAFCRYAEEGKRECYSGFAVADQDELYCQKLTGKDQGSCLDALSISRNDIALCEKAKLLGGGIFCDQVLYTRQALQDRDYNICNKISHVNLAGFNGKDSCFGRLATALGDAAICAKINNSMYREKCISGASGTSGGTAACLSYVTKGIRGILPADSPLTNCFTAAAVKAEDSQVCLSGKQDIDVNYCIEAIALETNNIDDCESLRLTPGPSKNAIIGSCFVKVVKKIRDFSICKRIKELDFDYDSSVQNKLFDECVKGKFYADTSLSIF